MSRDTNSVHANDSDAEKTVGHREQVRPISPNTLYRLLVGERVSDRAVGFHRAIESDCYSPRMFVSAPSAPSIFPHEIVPSNENDEDGRAMMSISYSSDGSKIISTNYDSEHTIKIYDATQSNKLLFEVVGHTRDVERCVVSPDGKKMVSASYDHTLKIWDMEKGCLLNSIDYGGMIFDCAISSDCKKIVACSNEKNVKVFDFESGQLLLTLNGHIDYVERCAFNPDNTKIISAARDKTAKVWDAETGRELFTIQHSGHGVHACLFSPDGSKIVTASGYSKNAFRISCANTGDDICVLGDSTKWLIKDCAFSSDGTKIISICAELGNFFTTGACPSMIKVWDVQTGACLTQQIINSPECMAVLGNQIVIGFQNGSIKQYNLENLLLSADQRNDDMRSENAAKPCCVPVGWL